MSDNIPPSQMLRVPSALVDAVKELSRLHRSGYTAAVLTGLQQLIASIDSTADNISSITAGKSDTELLAELIAGLDERIAAIVAVQIAQLEHRLSAQLENSKPQDVVGELPRLASANQSELEQSEVAQLELEQLELEQLELEQLELEQFRQTPPVVVESPARFEIDVDAQAANPIEDTALGGSGEVEDASVGNMLEGNPVPAQAATYVAKGTYAKMPPKKSGKKLPGVVAKRVEENLIRGRQLTANDLAPIIEVTAQAIRNRRDAEKNGKSANLTEWGLRLVPDSSDPQLYERI